MCRIYVAKQLSILTIDTFVGQKELITKKEKSIILNTQRFLKLKNLLPMENLESNDEEKLNIAEKMAAHYSPANNEIKRPHLIEQAQ